MNWISVKDRLPDNAGFFLVWEKYYSASTQKPCIGYYQDGIFETDIADDFSNVTHWAMPQRKRNK